MWWVGLDVVALAHCWERGGPTKLSPPTRLLQPHPPRLNLHPVQLAYPAVDKLLAANSACRVTANPLLPTPTPPALQVAYTEIDKLLGANSGLKGSLFWQWYNQVGLAEWRWGVWWLMVVAVCMCVVGVCMCVVGGGNGLSGSTPAAFRRQQEHSPTPHAACYAAGPGGGCIRRGRPRTVWCARARYSGSPAVGWWWGWEGP